MREVTLYGQGALVIYGGKSVYRAANGQITVPESHVRQAEAGGYSRTREPVGAPSAEERAAVATLSVETPKPKTDAEIEADAIRETEDRLRILRASTDERKAAYTKEGTDAGFSESEVAQIVDERLKFDELVAGGMSNEEASALVWPPTPPTP